MFFLKQKTAYEMRISDWSSDVCSSDLTADPAKTSGWRRPPQPQDGEGADPGTDARTGNPDRGEPVRLWQTHTSTPHGHLRRRQSVPPGSSEERRLGNEWVGTVRSRGSA